MAPVTRNDKRAGVLRDGLELAGRARLSSSHTRVLWGSQHKHAVWFVPPFDDPAGGYVNEEGIRARTR